MSLIPKFSPRVAAAFCLLCAGIAGCADGPTPHGTSNQQSLDPHTPYGAVNAYWLAIEQGDAATAADSVELGHGVDANWRQLQVEALIEDAKFYRVAESRYGRGAAGLICQELRLTVWLVPGEFGPGEFKPNPYDANLAVAWEDSEKTQEEAPPPIMHRGSDGIWRIWRPPRAAPPPPTMFAFQQHDILLKEKLIEAMNTGQYPTPDNLIQAIAAADRQPGLPSVAQLVAIQRGRQNLLTAKFDRSTIHGAIGAYYQAFMKGDGPGIADFFYSDGDSDGQLVSARAGKILSTLRLRDAIDEKFQVHDYDDFILKVGLNVPGDMPWFGDPGKEQGDRAAITFENNRELPCRKVGGVWKLDITPAKPQMPAGAASLLEHDIKVLDQLTANVLADKYKTLRDVQNAVMSAKPSGRSDKGQ